MNRERVNPAHRAPMTCPHCYSKHVIRYSTLALKYQTVQRFRCKGCSKTFTDKDTRHRSYPLKTILAAITAYNRGNTLEQASKQTARRYSTRIPRSTLHSWIKDYEHLCTFSEKREQALRKKSSRKDLILEKNLFHGQLYTYQLHSAKLALSTTLNVRKHALLENYLRSIPTKEFPHHIFIPKKDTPPLPRISRLRFPLLKTRILSKHTAMNHLASLALEFASTNKERHKAVQDFFIANDAHTIAAEIPVYLTGDDIRYFRSRGFSLGLQQRTPLTGHIDLLQLTNQSIRLLDYKPEAEQQDPRHQLTAYALALASRTKLAVKDIVCAWFDDRYSFEFFPLHAVYKRRKKAEIRPS